MGPQDMSLIITPVLCYSDIQEDIILIDCHHRHLSTVLLDKVRTEASLC